MNDTLKAAGRIGAELGAAKAEVERLRGLLHGAHDTIRNLAEDLDEEEFQVTIDQLAEIELALAPQQAEPKCSTCNDVGIIGHSDVCPDCADTWKQQAEPTDTYTAVDMATAAAQGFRDGQAAVEQAVAQDEDVYEQTYSHLCELLAPHTVEAGGQLPASVCDSFRVLLDAFLAHPAQTEQQPVGRVFTDEERFRSDGKSGPVWWFGPLPAGAMLYAAPIAQTAPQGKFRMGDLVKKSSGSEWVGHVCGWYSTNQTPEGYAVESEAHKGSVQIYPDKALEAVE